MLINTMAFDTKHHCPTNEQADNAIVACLIRVKREGPADITWRLVCFLPAPPAGAGTSGAGVRQHETIEPEIGFCPYCGCNLASARDWFSRNQQGLAADKKNDTRIKEVAGVTGLPEQDVAEIMSCL